MGASGCRTSAAPRHAWAFREAKGGTKGEVSGGTKVGRARPSRESCCWRAAPLQVCQDLLGGRAVIWVKGTGRDQLWDERKLVFRLLDELLDLSAAYLALNRRNVVSALEHRHARLGVVCDDLAVLGLGGHALQHGERLGVQAEEYGLGVRHDLEAYDAGRSLLPHEQRRRELARGEACADTSQH